MTSTADDAIDYDAVVVGGRGAVGTQLGRLLAADGLSVVTVDPAPRASTTDDRFRHLEGDVLAPDRHLSAVLSRASIVVLAVPETVALRVPLSLFADTALVVETLSVKSGFAEIAAGQFGPQILGINPMFAPSLGMDGRPVACVIHRPGDLADEFLLRIAKWGGRVVALDADAHDRLAAATQALVHAAILAFGTALAELGVDPLLVDAVAPPPARTLLALLTRISGGEPEVYWDVQAGNPHAARARRALATAVGGLDDAVVSEPNFGRYLQQFATLVPDADEYRALCARLFGIVREPARKGEKP